MYAIARIAGKQFRIEPELNVKVPKLDVEEGSSYEISEILMTSDGKKIQVGTPLIEGLKATAKVISHGRDPKIIVFRKKRRKGFKVTRGHRQGFTLLRIENIQGLTAKPKAAEKPKKEAKPKEVPEPEAKAEPKAKAKPKAPVKRKAPAKPKPASKAKAAKPKTAAKLKAPAKKKTVKSEKSEGE